MASKLHYLHYIASSKTHGNTMWLPKNWKKNTWWFRSDFYDPSIYFVVSQCKAHKDSLKQRISRGTDDNLENSRINEQLEILKRYPTIKRGQLFDMLCKFSVFGYYLSLRHRTLLMESSPVFIVPKSHSRVGLSEDQRDDFKNTLPSSLH